jgi:hypothetical protein
MGRAERVVSKVDAFLTANDRTIPTAVRHRIREITSHRGKVHQRASESTKSQSKRVRIQLTTQTQSQNSHDEGVDSVAGETIDTPCEEELHEARDNTL